MYIPHTFAAALALIVVSMLGWGSWPNFMKALPKWRLEYFYLDYTLGFLITVIVLAATIGSRGVVSADFIHRWNGVDPSKMWTAALGGFIWNFGNILLLNAIMIAGIAVAYPVASVLGMVLGVGVGYWAQPIGNTTWLIIAVIILCVAACVNAASYRKLGASSGTGVRKGLLLSLMAGILIGLFTPFVGKALSGQHPLDSYNVSFFFMLGAAAATLVCVPILLAKPLVGVGGSLKGYFGGNTGWHVMGLLAGVVWCVGTVSNFVSAGVVGVAISWGIGNGAPMVGALWGIFLWKEFKDADRSARMLMATSLCLYVVGVVAVAAAYHR